MMKSYLRYEPSHSFGVICSPSSNATFDFSGNLILTAAVEDVPPCLTPVSTVHLIT